LAAWTWRNRGTIVAIHANGLKELSVVAPTVFLTGLPLVVWVHNHTLPPSIRLLGPVWRVLLRNRRVRWAAVSATGRDRAVEAGLVRAADVVIVPNPIDPADVRADHREPASRLRVAYLGSPEEYKGFRLLPQLIERTADLPVDWLVFTAQTSAANADTWGRLHELAASGRVELVGKLPDVRLAYARCDIVVCPSYRDSFCRVAAEAMLNGIPVVGSDLDPIRALLGEDEAGLLFPRGDVDAAVAAIGRLVGDDELRARLGSAGPARAAVFSTSGVVSQLRSLYGLRAA
jgi:glycosyltransferase involved in cell wall biosynthesis